MAVDAAQGLSRSPHTSAKRRWLQALPAEASAVAKDEKAEARLRMVTAGETFCFGLLVVANLFTRLPLRLDRNIMFQS